jgi:hypothetical protein
MKCWVQKGIDGEDGGNSIVFVFLHITDLSNLFPVFHIYTYYLTIVTLESINADHFFQTM